MLMLKVHVIYLRQRKIVREIRVRLRILHAFHNFMVKIMEFIEKPAILRQTFKLYSFMMICFG